MKGLSPKGLTAFSVFNKDSQLAFHHISLLNLRTTLYAAQIYKEILHTVLFLAVIFPFLLGHQPPLYWNPTNSQLHN